MLNSLRTCILKNLVFFVLLIGCKNKNGGSSGASGINVNVLKKHHTLKFNKHLLLGLPVKLKYDDKTDHLFILDAAKRKVIEINNSNKVVDKFSGKGKGPGESERVDNFFITPQYLYTVDEAQRLINKYSLQDGHYISGLNYGHLVASHQNRALYMDNNNQPFVTKNGTILLPTQTGGKHLYEAVNWKGKKLADIGDIPKGYSTKKNYDKSRSKLINEKIPASDMAEAFPVNDCQDHRDIYLVYPAFPKIAKYSLSGKKLWAHKIPRTPEVDSLIVNLSVFTKMLKHRPNNRGALPSVRTYVAGRCSPDGNLYLTTYTHPTRKPSKLNRPLWIDQFSPKGNLIKRYKVGSSVGDFPFSGIDFKNHRIFISSSTNAHVSIYHF